MMDDLAQVFRQLLIRELSIQDKASSRKSLVNAKNMVAK